MARTFICTFGMSDTLGPRKYGKGSSEVFLGRDYSDHSKDYSNETAHEIDLEIKNLIQECYEQAENILKENAGRKLRKHTFSQKTFLENTQGCEKKLFLPGP